MNSFSLGISLRSNFGLLFLLLLLAACETLPEHTYTTSSGCGIAQFDKNWWSANVKEMSWSGPCEGGLASGSGRLVVRLNNGKEERYNGIMQRGLVWGEGERIFSDGWRLTGTLMDGYLLSGKVFTPKGQLRYEGVMRHDGKDPSGNTISLSQQRFGTGTLYLLDAAETKIEQAEFDGTSGLYAGARSVNPDTGGGFMIGTVERKGQAPVHFIEGKAYAAIDEAYLKQKGAYYDRQLAQIQKQAQVDAENQRRQLALLEQQERQQREQSRRELSEALGILNQGLQDYAPQRQNQNNASAPVAQAQIPILRTSPPAQVQRATSGNTSATGSTSESAMQCVSVTKSPSGGWDTMQNNCAHTITVSWCYAGTSDCRNGTWGHTNRGNIAAVGTRSASTLVSRAGQYGLAYAACKGRDVNIQETGPKTFICK